MPIDLNQMSFSDEEIPGLAEDQTNWQAPSEFPPMPPGGEVYRLFIKEISDIREKMTDQGPRLVCQYVGEILDGPGGDKTWEGRTVNYQYLSNVMFNTQDRGRTSTMLDLIKCAKVQGTVKTNKQFVEILNRMEGNKQYSFKALLDWEGSCPSCYNAKSMELTGAATPDLAKLQIQGNKNLRDAANEFALKFKNFRTFPLAHVKGKDDDPRRRTPMVECPTCHEEVRARLQLRRFVE